MMFHSLNEKEVLKELKTSIDGLSSEEVENRFKSYGHNKLSEAKKETLLHKFIMQFNDPMIIILLVAAFVSVAVTGFHDWVDAVIILIVVLINSILGVAQESKAEKAIENLQKMSSPFCKVKRNGNIIKVATTEIVPGDIVLLEAGDYVPADIRLIEVANLKVEEAALTGESVPVQKSIDLIKEESVPIGDRKNMTYMGSSITYGRAIGVVVGTGMSTEMGKIATILTNTDKNQTPLQIKMAELSKMLSFIILGVCLVMFVVGTIVNDSSLLEMFMIAVSLAVAAIPEGLVAVVTIVLALGVSRMAKQNAIIRKLPAVETLGCAQIICSDKTGTLTQNKMTVIEVSLNNKNINVVDNLDKLKVNKDAILLTNIMALCNDSKVTKEGEIGDPTETALIHLAEKLSIEQESLNKTNPRIGEVPFDSVRKLMSTINKVSKDKITMFTKGAPDELLRRCTHYLSSNGPVPMTDNIRKEILTCNKLMGEKALRVLAGAYKDFSVAPKNYDETLEKDLVFVGLVGMIDPVRPEAIDSVRTCKEAGIRTIMITGDHKETAIAIAKELKLITNDSEAITGLELDKISDKDFERDIEKYSVYARVSPEHKVRIVNAWKKKGMITAMTGDGVNDAPALKSADIGIGMGITGTDVSKGVADMVLADDNFSTIVSAVSEGRKIYSNIRKAIQFLLSSNACEVIAIFIATMFGIVLLTPVQLLWVNLVTDCFPALALGMEPKEKDIMKQKPRNSKEGFFTGDLKFNIIYQSFLLATIILVAYMIGSSYSEQVAMTMAFATLAIVELFHSFNLRSQTKSILTVNPLGNPYLIGAFVISFVITILVINVPFLNNLFGVVQLSFEQWAIVLGLSFSIIPLVEIVKFIRRKTAKG